MRMAFSNCFVIDCVQPEPIANATVTIEDGVITSVYRGAVIEPGTKVLDLKRAYLLPGLWESHCHPGGMIPDPENYSAFETEGERTLRALRNTQGALQTGITSIRSAGEANFIDVALKEAYANKTPTGMWHDAYTAVPLYGPRMFVAGPMLQITGGHGSNRRIKPVLMSYAHVEVDGPGEMRKATRYNIKMGVDWIKLAITGGIAGIREEIGESQMTFEEIKVACDTAHNKGLKVGAHAGRAEAVKLAISAGIDSVEHGYELDQEAVDMMAKKGVFYVPTLSVTQDEAYMRHYHWPEHSLRRAQEGSKIHLRSFQMALEAEVKIASGADLNPMCETSVNEVKWLTRSGMSNWQALVAATHTSAELCGVADKLGTVEVGKIADFIVVAANPLDDISNLNKLQLVVKEGVIVAHK